MPRRRGRPRKGCGGAARGRGGAARGGATHRYNPPRNEGRTGRRAVKYNYTDEMLLAAWHEYHK